ncbi:MAG: globin [Armatimonadetes bacterium]|nr:globin [Armatimonadota bacterium]
MEKPTSSIIAFTGTFSSVYEQVGGMETFRRLADAFYRRFEADPLLGPMMPGDLAPARERQALFLAQFFGGPTTYSEKRGHPRLRMRHLPFSIGKAERDAWVAHMADAMEEVGIQEPARTTMRRYFEDAATFLINRPESADP